MRAAYQRWVVLVVLFAGLPPPLLLGGAAQAQRSSQAEREACPDNRPRNRGIDIAGKVLGGAASKALEGVGLAVPTSLRNDLNALLVNAIACRLNAQERERAAEATETIVDAPVGTTATWESGSRPEVGGSTTKVAQLETQNGTDCFDARDVATVDGEEVVLTKRMCRGPTDAGYKLVSAQV